jgi:hypothetical protein
LSAAIKNDPETFKIESGGFGKTVRLWTRIGRARVLITVTLPMYVRSL